MCAARLRRSSDIAAVRREGRSVRRSGFSARIRRSAGHDVRLAFATPRSLGTAVVRNRAKRRVREAFRAAASMSRSVGIDLVVTPRPEALQEGFISLRDAAASVLGEPSR